MRVKRKRETKAWNAKNFPFVNCPCLAVKNKQNNKCVSLSNTSSKTSIRATSMAFLLPCQRNLAVQNRNKKFVFSITALAIKNMRMKKNNKIIFLALTSRYAFPMTASAKPCDKKKQAQQVCLSYHWFIELSRSKRRKRKRTTTNKPFLRPRQQSLSVKKPSDKSIPSRSICFDDARPQIELGFRGQQHKLHFEIESFNIFRYFYI